MTGTRAFICFICVLGLFALGAAAQDLRDHSGEDVLLLKNGREFQGRLVEQNAESVTFMFRGSEIILPARLVKEVKRGERQLIEKAAAEEPSKILSAGDRFDERNDLYYVYYRGRRVGWRVPWARCVRPWPRSLVAVRDIDTVLRTIHVRQTVSEVEGRLSIAATKSRASRRTISAPPFLLDELVAHLRREGRRDADALHDHT